MQIVRNLMNLSSHEYPTKQITETTWPVRESRPPIQSSRAMYLSVVSKHDSRWNHTFCVVSRDPVSDHVSSDIHSFTETTIVTLSEFRNTTVVERISSAFVSSGRNPCRIQSIALLLNSDETRCANANFPCLVQCFDEHVNVVGQFDSTH